MGKTRKNIIKKEKSKVKLKGTKTVLPKGQNLTATNFKVKKIVIKDQVKPGAQEELLTSRKLNLQELMSRLGHHNVNVRKEALDGLNELFISYPSKIIRLHLALLLQNLPKLILDQVGRIRKETIKLLANIFSETEYQQLEPFFPSVSSYLICGLTHIDCAFREDSLYFLDVLLKYVPLLCAKTASKLLPVCLDLISHINSFNRTLSLNLDSSITSIKWRLKVLFRIRLILTTLIDFSETGSKEEFDREIKDVERPNKEKYPFFRIKECTLSKLSLDCLGREDEAPLDYSLKDFSDAIIPLLLDMFIEIVPMREDYVGISLDVSTFITEEVADILQNIVDIIQLLWDIVSKEDNSEEKLNYLSKEHSKAVLEKLIKGKFPYAIRTNKKRKAFGDGGENEKIDTSGKMQNLSLCKLTILLGTSSSWKCIIPYLKSMFRNADGLNNSLCVLFSTCISNICLAKKSEESKYFLSQVSKTVMSSNNTLSNNFFLFLVDIALSKKCKEFHSEISFVVWLESLPKKLTKSKITAFVLEKICQIAVRNFIPFIASLDAHIEAILDNIPSIYIDGINAEQGQMKIASLLYYVKEWDQELIDGLHKPIKNEFWGPRVTAYIKDILYLKISKIKNSAEVQTGMQ